MKTEKLFNECLANVPNDITIEIDLSFDIANKIDKILSDRKISQKDFAAMIGKKESEISKWLKGTHNFTLRTIAKISAVLEEPDRKSTRLNSSHPNPSRMPSSA